MNISPEEIDQLLGGYDGVLEACAFPVPDPILGERIGLAVVPAPGKTVTLGAITEYLKSRGVAVFKLPEKLYFLGPLPRNALNKVLRHEVRELALSCDEGRN